MNKIYKSIWNEQTGTYVAVSENTKARGKRSSSALLASAILAAVVGTAQAQTIAVGDEPAVTGSTIVFSESGEIQTTGGLNVVGGFKVGGEAVATHLELTSLTGANTTAISGLDVRVGANETAISGLDGKVGANETAISGLDGKVGANETAISGLDGKVGANEIAINTLQAAVGVPTDGTEPATGLFKDVADLNANLTATNTAHTDFVEYLGVDTDEAYNGIKYFRVNSTKADANAVGVDSIAIGPLATAEGDSSTAIGHEAIAQNTSSIAIGHNARSNKSGGGDDDEANTIAIGTDSKSGSAGSTAIGYKATTSGTDSLALGTLANASGANAVVLGKSASASGGNGIALGESAAASGFENISIGSSAGKGTTGTTAADRGRNVAIGYQAGQRIVGRENTSLGALAGNGTEGDYNVALGTKSGQDIGGNSNISIGLGANNNTDDFSIAEVRHNTIAIGERSIANTEAVAVGVAARAKGVNSIAMGPGANSNANAVAIGAAASATTGSIALGTNSIAIATDIGKDSAVTDRSFSGSVLSVGNRAIGLTRRIVNVEDGANDTDAVNVRQLTAAINKGVVLDYDALAEKIGTNWGNKIANVAPKYLSINADNEASNKGNEGASGLNSMALGPSAVAQAASSTVVGYGVTSTPSATSSVVMGHDLVVSGAKTVTIGNTDSYAKDTSGIAIGTQVYSRGENSVVIGVNSGSNKQKVEGVSVENSIVIGTLSESTAVEGIVIGKESLVNSARGIAIGSDAETTAKDAMSFGTTSRASGANSIAQGNNAAASATDAMAQGTNSTAHASQGIAIGAGADSGYVPANKDEGARNINSIAIGADATAWYENALALGVSSEAKGTNASASGTRAKATAENSIASGTDAQASALGSIATGANAQASGSYSIATGTLSVASGENSVAMGNDARATHENSVALGAGSVTAPKHGTTAEGDYAIGDFKADGQKNPVTTGVVSVGAVGAERQIINVAPGVLSATSTDAINGSQLFATNTYLTNLHQATADSLGGDTTITPDGKFKGPSYQFDNEVGSPEHNNVGDALQALHDLGLNFEGDNPGDAARVHRELGQTLGLKGGAPEASLTDNNIGVVRNAAQNGYDIKLNKDINLTDAGSVIIGATTVNNNGLVITGGPSVTNNGINAGSKVISNVSPGQAGTDAVNVNQLTQATSGWLLQAEGVTGQAAVKSGDIVRFVDGKNMEVSRTTAADGAELITYSTSDDVEFTNIVVGDTVINEDNGVTTNKVVINHPGTTTPIDVGEELSKGITFSADSGTGTLQKLGGELKIAGGDNITTTVTDGEVQVALNKNVDLGADGSVTTGNALLNTDGLTVAGVSPNDSSTAVGAGVITIEGSGATSNKITIAGETGDITGLTNITWDPAGTYDDGRAATEEQLKLVSDVAQNANQGWNVTTNADATTSENVAPGATVDFDNTDGNIVIDQDGTDLVFNLSDTLSIGGDGKDGSIGVKGKDGKDGISINPDAIVFHGIDGVDGKDGSMTMTTGAAGVDGKDGITRIQYTDPDGRDFEVATLDDGMKFVGDDGKVVERKLNETLSLTGGATGELSTGNIGVVQNGSGGLSVQLASELNGLESVTTNNFNAGGGTMVVNPGSVTIAEGTTVNMGGNPITNVAPGVDGTDAVNVNQLNAVAGSVNNLSRNLNRVDREARAGTASAAAMANLPQAYLPGKSMFAVAGAGHRGESGYAAGLSTISDNGKWVIKGSVAGNSRGDVTYGVGAGYQW